MNSVAIVIPTLGRPSLRTLLESLADSRGPRPERIVLADDRPFGVCEPLDTAGLRGWPVDVLDTVRCGGRGPAAARNAGWRQVGTDWVVFLDDDVRLTGDWLADLATDLALDAGGDRPALPADVGGSQARLSVPLPRDRRPTDWERGTAGLADARWITADFAYRRTALARVNGFDERFPRAFREDADLALRVAAAGFRIVQGSRRTVHPVRRVHWRTSLDQQRGNADDALMRRLHGASWHRRAGATVGRRPAHLAVTSAMLLALGAAPTGRRRVAALGAGLWAAGTAEFAWRRIAPGPRDRDEVLRMVATSALIPPAASWHWLRGWIRHRQARPWPGAHDPAVRAVLFDRDGTLIRDVPYNGDPGLVEPLPGVREALDALRAAGIKTGVISNQSGVARGLLDAAQVEAVNRRVDEMLGPFDDWRYCPHDDTAQCGCRKPAPGLVRAAAAALGVVPNRCLVIGDIGSDVAAALAAGARGFLVPTAQTRPEETAAAPFVFDSVHDAVDALLGVPPRQRPAVAGSTDDETVGV